MTRIDMLFWIVIPYISIAIFILGHIYRYNTDQFGWTAKSSQFLEQRKLRLGSILFHYGIIFVFFGHVAGLLIPKAWFDFFGVTSDMYHFGAVFFGGIAGIVTVIGGALLFWRRVSVKRIIKNSDVSDYVALVILGIVVLVGFTNTVGYTASGGTFDYRVTIGPWLREIITLRPSEGMVLDMANSPLGFQAHVLLAFFLFAVWPFTRLVHVFSLPLKYLQRRYIPYRNMRSPRKAKLPQRNKIN